MRLDRQSALRSVLGMIGNVFGQPVISLNPELIANKSIDHISVLTVFKSDQGRELPAFLETRYQPHCPAKNAL